MSTNDDTDKCQRQLIRARRRAAKLGQAVLAARVGVSRQWIVAVEAGKPRAELGLALATLSALGVSLRVDEGRPSPRVVTTPDIDAIVRAARGPKR